MNSAPSPVVSEALTIRRALLSVSDKTGLDRLARALAAQGVELVSTGGTAQTLKAAGLAVTEVSTLTGFPEMLDGRVKTLHPAVHAGLLARRGQDDAVLAAHGLKPFDLLVVNLYPFESVTRNPACGFDQGVENIDVGGPAMLRAAAKNHAHIAVVVDPGDYAQLLACLSGDDPGVDLAIRRQWAVKAFRHTANYDAAIAAWLANAISDIPAEGFQPTRPVGFGPAQALRYGENPHQQAALFVAEPARPGSVAGATQLAGKPLSYNNLLDADAAWDSLIGFPEPACVIVKHNNPCGVAIADDPLAAYVAAYATDPLSAFGGVIAFNRTLTGELLRAILEQQFVEVILAPEVTETALVEAERKPDVRILRLGAAPAPSVGLPSWRTVSGGLLVQSPDWGDEAVEEGVSPVVTRVSPTLAQWADLRFAWRVCRGVRSNAIVYASGGRTLGIGAGQSSRVDSTRIAQWKAADRGLVLNGAVMASDAFLPFRDGLDAAAQAGVAAVIQPGGSIRDAEVIAAADEHGIAMVFTGRRHFRH